MKFFLAFLSYYLLLVVLVHRTIVDGAIVTLTSNDVQDAIDIELAVQEATRDGTEVGRVILDGKNGPFHYTGSDRSINVNVSNITFQGTNNAILSNCDGAFFFDLDNNNNVISNIHIIAIAMSCSGPALSGRSTPNDLYFRGNVVQTLTNTGIFLGSGDHWEILRNTILAPNGDGIRFGGATNYHIRDNTIHAKNIGIWLDNNDGINEENLIKTNQIYSGHIGIYLNNISNSKILKNSICLPETAGIHLSESSSNNLVFTNQAFSANSNFQVVQIDNDNNSNNNDVSYNGLQIESCEVPYY